MFDYGLQKNIDGLNRNRETADELGLVEKNTTEIFRTKEMLNFALSLIQKGGKEMYF